MKKSALILSGIVIVTVAFLIVSCKKTTDANNVNIPQRSSNSLNANELGKIHNLFLTHFKNEFEPDPKLSTVEQGIEFINQFYTVYANNLKMNDKEKNMLVESLNDYKRFVHSQQFYYELYRMDMKTMCDSCYSSVVYQARSIGMIDDFEYNKLEQIGQIVKDNCDGIVSNDELKRCIMAIDDEAKEYYGSTNSNDGQTLAITLSIAFASIEWWEENPDAFGDINNSKVLPAWVGADIAGAAYGAIVSGVGSYVTTGSVNWGGVGISAAAGAISGSTGIIGKAGKWLTNLF